MSYARTLKRAGLRVRVDYASPRHRPGPFSPLGIIVHHTAGPKTGDHPSLSVIKNGRAGVPGPLSQFLLARSGLWIVCANGRANHAGKGSSVVLRESRRGVAPSGTASKRNLPDDTDGNTWYVGVEVENDGRGQPYPDVQLDSLTRGCIALNEAFGWNVNATIGHKEWTFDKIDPRGINMTRFRKEIARPQEQEEDMALSAEDKNWIASQIERRSRKWAFWMYLNYVRSFVGIPSTTIMNENEAKAWGWAGAWDADMVKWVQELSPKALMEKCEELSEFDGVDPNAFQERMKEAALEALREGTG